MSIDDPHTTDTDHVLSARACEGVQLPEAALKILQTAGVPRELVLPEWQGPTLFHSEIGEGALRSTRDEDALVHRSGAHEGYILGSVRDVNDEKAPPYAVFVLRSQGDVYLLDMEDAEQDRFVNANLDAFLASILAFHAGFDAMVAVTPEREQWVRKFRDLLTRLDARALGHADHYWPGWLDELE